MLDVRTSTSILIMQKCIRIQVPVQDSFVMELIQLHKALLEKHLDLVDLLWSLRTCSEAVRVSQ